jgi:hypothetical protein
MSRIPQSANGIAERNGMSQFTFFASNAPLENIENPHAKSVSVNEAIALGMDIPKFMLSDFDRDKPDVLLWTDDDFDLGDITIFEANWCKYPSYSARMKYNSIVEWVYTEERAKQLIAYIKHHLESTDSIEIWHIWLDSGNEIMGQPENVVILMNDLTPLKLAEFLKDDCYESGPVCITVKN